ncbi:MAG: hypothetical protein ACHQAZ_04340, partial [Gammaproteobacteria bacterium]
TGLVLISADGTHWNGQYPVPANLAGSFQGFSAIGSGNGTVVLGDGLGLNLNTTTDGATWKPAIPSSTTASFYSYYKLMYFAGKFYGFSNEIESSPDGLNLGQTVSFPGSSVCDVTTNGSIMVATDTNGDFYTTTDGTHWTGPGPQTPVACFPLQNSRTQLQWTGKDFAWLISGVTYYSSTDGLHWTARTVNNSFIFTQLIWDGSKYIGIGVNGLIATSTDGITFTRVAGSSQTANSGDTMAWTGSTYVIGETDGSNSYSLLVGSGSNWQAVAQPIKQVSFVNDTLYGFNDLDFNRMVTSADGITWNRSTLTPGALSDPNVTAVAGDGHSQVVAVGQSAGAISTDDGATWTTQTVSLTEAPIKVVRGSGKYVGITSSHIITSSDGINWSDQQLTNSSGRVGHYADILYGHGLYIALSQDGTEFTSTDATNWSSHTALPGTTSTVLWSAVWDGDEFIATAVSSDFVTTAVTNSTLWTSADGLTWYPEIVPSGGAASALAVGNGEVLASGWQGMVMRAVPGQRGLPVAHAVSISIDPSKAISGNFSVSDPQNLPLIFSGVYAQCGILENGYTITIPKQAHGNFTITPFIQPPTTPFSFDYVVSNDVVYSAPATVSVTIEQPVTPPPSGGGGGGGGSGGGKSGGGSFGLLALAGIFGLTAMRRRREGRG